MYSENDELCASIISQAIRNNSDRDDDTRVASSTAGIARDRNQVYALRQKMFGPYIPKSSTKTRTSRTASISESIEPTRNKVYQLRRVMFGGC